MKFFSVMYQTSNSKGQELVAQRMVKWARKLGYEAWLITSVYHDDNTVIPVDKVWSREGYVILDDDPSTGLPVIRVDSFKVSWPPRRIMFRDFIAVLRRIDKTLGVDFIVTHSTLWNGPIETARWVLWKNIVKSLGGAAKPTIYGHMSHYQPPDPVRYSLIERAYRMAWNISSLPAILKSADLVLCTTGIEAEDMMSYYGARPEQIHIFPGGLDDDLAALIDNAKPDAFLEKYNIGKDKLIIAYLGTVEERKNPLAVVKVAKKLEKLRDVVFVIAGRPGSQWEDVLREARDLENVVITGELSTELKASLIKASYLNIIMSKLEALGITQIEFMYGGVPVISSGTYGQKWLITHNVDGIIVKGPDDIEGAAKAIEELVKNPNKREYLSANARKKASGFLMSKLVEQLMTRAKSLLIEKEKQAH
uniref:Glycosyltransferase n=1 Tax=Ignisphaera aggregans TaxID=334771 RepID=A0A7C2V9A7_9CREN